MKSYVADETIFSFSSQMEAISKILPGEIVEISTMDCFSGQISKNEDLINEVDFDQVNPATGPFHIEGAEKGDSLKIEIIDIEIAEQGVCVAVPGVGVLGDDVVDTISRVMKIKDGKIDYLGKEYDLNPMIGVIGVSPGGHELSISTGTPGKHGGNMDTTDIRKGSIVYFPVLEDGALFALGDFHAVMGDGEISGAGLEVSGKARLRFTLIKDKQLNWPLIETDEKIMVVASGKNLEEALEESSRESVILVKNNLDISFEEALIFNSLFVDYKISQAVNPKKTIRSSIPKKYLDMNKIWEK